jgi:glycosyltransferase involved in cell wall biosynthesis
VKVIHAVATLDPAGGGPPQVAVRLAAAQAALGHDVHLVFNASAASQARVQAQTGGVPHVERIVLHPIAEPGRVERLWAPRARRLLAELIQGADFVHIHGLWGSLLGAAAACARDNRVPYCFRPAGMLDPWSLAQKRWKKRLALGLRYRELLNAAAFIHTLNADEQRLIAPLGLTAPTIVLPNGVFIEELDPLPAPGTFRAAHPALGAAPFVLFLSRLHTKKGLDILADAFAELARRRPDVHLVVAGPDEGAQPDFARRVNATRVAARVHLVGPLYGRDKLAALVDAACFCLPSRQEGFSVAITEALACGRPVVISEACHFPEVASAKAGAVVPLEPSAVARALEEILGDPALAARMGQAGAALVRQRYTWDAIAAATLSAYQGPRR